MTTSTDHDADTTARDINLLARFLANPQIPSLHLLNDTNTSTPLHQPQVQSNTPVNPSTIIIAASAILHQAHTIFSFFQSHLPTTQSHASSITTLVLTGGIGHSTVHLYNALLHHPKYASLLPIIGRPNNDVHGLSEAEIFHLIFVHFYDGENVTRAWNAGRGLKVLVEGESTNCGANAVLSRVLLERNGVVLGSGGGKNDDGVVDDVVVVQDPTMCLRTKASFEKVYEADDVFGGRLRFWNLPVFVPCVKETGSGVVAWDGAVMDGVDVGGLWDLKRFYGLLLGEIERLRDDELGYGPRGKGFIAHVDIPEEVERAYGRLNNNLDSVR